MKREASDRLDRWLGQTDRKPLVLRGARQTGKTWLVRDLAARSGRRLVEINFERSPELADYFTAGDPKLILQNIGAHLGTSTHAANTLLFLDEIQAAPAVLSALRWFKEDLPDLPVAAAGSLLDFVLKEHSFSMPVGRIGYFHVEPMSFLEFVRATGNQPLYEMLKKATLDTPLDSALHTKCMDFYRIYCLCGGMPESVKKWIEHQDSRECMNVQRDLLATLRDDFNKYGKHPDMLRKTLRSAAEQLGGKFVLSRVDEGIRSASARDCVQLLEMARVLTRVRHTAGNGLPLGAEVNEKFFKIIGLDVGLIAVQLGLGALPPGEWKSLALSNRGAIAEQFVGQQLRYALAADGEPALNYWQRTGGRQGEIDYLVQSGAAIMPIEVKSGSRGAMKSLHQFMFEKGMKQAIRFDGNPPAMHDMHIKTTQGDPVEYSLISLPIYLAERVFDLVPLRS